MMKKTISYQKGQAVLIVMLVMAVGLTIGLALMSQTTTDIKISQQQEESARAFSAAEAGIEELLRPGVGSGDTFLGSPDEFSGASVDASITEATGRANFLFPDEIQPGHTATLWLNGHDADGNFDPTAGGQYGGSSFDLCWDGEAIEVSVYYREVSDAGGGDYKVARGAYDPNRTSDNNFAAPDGVGCLDLANQKTVRFSDLGIPGNKVLLFANLKPYYGAAKIGVEAVSAVLPSQGQEIQSTGSVGEITRKVRVFRSWPAPPAIFDYGIFSSSNLVKSP